MLYRIAVDIVVITHMGFIVFAVFGGLLSRWHIKIAWIHIPVLAWATVVEVSGWICPLTPLENHFRLLAGHEGYRGGFLEHYLIPVIYPAGLTRPIQLALALFLILFNLIIYWPLIRSRVTISKVDDD
jgi:hypothetical protein